MHKIGKAKSTDDLLLESDVELLDNIPKAIKVDSGGQGHFKSLASRLAIMSDEDEVEEALYEYLDNRMKAIRADTGKRLLLLKLYARHSRCNVTKEFFESEYEKYKKRVYNDRNKVRGKHPTIPDSSNSLDLFNVPSYSEIDDAADSWIDVPAMSKPTKPPKAVITLRAMAPLVPPGVGYRCRFEKLEQIDGCYGRPALHWVFRVDEGQHRGKVIVRITGLIPASNNACGKMVRVVTGEDAREGVEYNIEAYIGCRFAVNVHGGGKPSFALFSDTKET